LTLPSTVSGSNRRQALRITPEDQLGSILSATSGAKSK
jgi:hypothetical protein